MSRITRSHSQPFAESEGLQSDLNSIHVLIASIRDSALPMPSKKRMLNHALWEITHVRGNFLPEFRSESVLQGMRGVKIERDHIYKRKRIVQDILCRVEALDIILERVIHCVVTEEEHERLTRVPESLDGWDRYAVAKVVVPRR